MARSRKITARGRAHCMLVLGIVLAFVVAGCRSTQQGEIMTDDDADMVGSHSAGAATYDALVEEGVSNFLGQYEMTLAEESAGIPDFSKRICFFGVENEGHEELGSYKASMEQKVMTSVAQARLFEPLSQRYIEAGLNESGLRPDQLFLPANQRQFASSMEQMGQPFDYFLFAKVTSTHTQDNLDSQRNYELTLELVDVRDGRVASMDTVSLRKGYNRTAQAKVSAWDIWPF